MLLSMCMGGNQPGSQEPSAPRHLPASLEPRLMAATQFELISCFRWNLANQGRQGAEVDAIKLTTP